LAATLNVVLAFEQRLLFSSVRLAPAAWLNSFHLNFFRDLSEAAMDSVPISGLCRCELGDYCLGSETGSVLTRLRPAVLLSSRVSVDFSAASNDSTFCRPSQLEFVLHRGHVDRNEYHVFHYFCSRFGTPLVSLQLIALSGATRFFASGTYIDATSAALQTKMRCSKKLKRKLQETHDFQRLKHIFSDAGYISGVSRNVPDAFAEHQPDLGASHASNVATTILHGTQHFHARLRGVDPSRGCVGEHHFFAFFRRRI
jgi:hypothetical protein